MCCWESRIATQKRRWKFGQGKSVHNTSQSLMMSWYENSRLNNTSSQRKQKNMFPESCFSKYVARSGKVTDNRQYNCWSCCFIPAWSSSKLVHCKRTMNTNHTQHFQSQCLHHTVRVQSLISLFVYSVPEWVIFINPLLFCVLQVWGSLTGKL